MASNERNNQKVIRSAFRRLAGSKDSAIESGMKDLLENAMLFAIGEHDNRHWFHKATANSYGWVLLHDGRAVAHKVNEGRHGDGNAYGNLMEVSREVSQAGWVGILVASMEGENPMFFAVDYEIGLLQETAIHSREDFNRFFKPLHR